jgi:hypothetical protein
MQIRARDVKYGILQAREALYHYSKIVKTDNWQGAPAPFDFLEVLNMNIEMPMCKDLNELVMGVGPLRRESRWLTFKPTTFA